MRSRAREHTSGVTRRSIKASGSTIRCMDTDTLSGLMANSTKASLKRTSVMVMVNSSGEMGVNTRVVGTVENRAVSDTTSISTK